MKQSNKNKCDLFLSPRRTIQQIPFIKELTLEEISKVSAANSLKIDHGILSPFDHTLPNEFSLPKLCLINSTLQHINNEKYPPKIQPLKNPIHSRVRLSVSPKYIKFQKPVQHNSPRIMNQN